MESKIIKILEEKTKLKPIELYKNIIRTNEGEQNSKCICGVNIENNYFIIINNIHFVIGSTCIKNIVKFLSLEKEKIENYNRDHQEQLEKAYTDLNEIYKNIKKEIYTKKKNIKNCLKEEKKFCENIVEKEKEDYSKILNDFYEEKQKIINNENKILTKLRTYKDKKISFYEMLNNFKMYENILFFYMTKYDFLSKQEKDLLKFKIKNIIKNKNQI